MQISIYEEYPGHCLNACHVEVFLDGKKVMNCVAVDEEAETAVLLKMVDGKLFINGSGNVERETVQGKYKIILPVGWKPAWPCDYMPINAR